VRVRIGNLSMTNHPIHKHGEPFEVTCTDGGWLPVTARRPDVTTDVPVGAVRVIEFVADAPGDWAIHCHKSHHTMNAMAHNLRTFIGAKSRDLTPGVRKLVPDYMPMGASGMAEMGKMEMPMPENTLPMMTGFGQFGPMEMGGMFSVIKVREGLAPMTTAIPVPTDIPREPSPTSSRAMPASRTAAAASTPPAAEFNVIKPGGKPPHEH
jgi:manganese oxidase